MFFKYILLFLKLCFVLCMGNGVIGATYTTVQATQALASTVMDTVQSYSVSANAVPKNEASADTVPNTATPTDTVPSNAALGSAVSVESAESEPVAHIGELWTGSLYSSTYKAGVCIDKDGAVRGVLHLRLKSGKVDTYHFYGQQNTDGTIKAKHSSGNRFEGYFKNATTIKGKVRTKHGFTVSLEGRRMQNVLLTEACGPLPE